MNTSAVLAYVKASLGITGEYHDALLTNYINEVAMYMLAAGVSTTVMATEAVYGCIARGVADLWQYGAGEGKLSPYFKERVIQLATTVEVANV